MVRFKLVFISWLFVAISSHASFTPITNFTKGNYVGRGELISEGSSSKDVFIFINMKQNGWTTAQFEIDGIHVYKTDVSINDAGFVHAEMFDQSTPSNPIYYPGYGNCGQDYCQTTTYLHNGKLWRLYTFNNDNTISIVGSIWYDDGTPNVQWKALAVRIP